MFIAYVDPSEPYHPITKWDFEDQRKPMEKETRNSEPEPNEDTSLQNPLPKNEHVGIDEEGMYLTSDSNVVANVNLVVSCDKRKDTDYDPEDDGDGDESEGAQSEDVEEEEELIHEEEDKIQEPDHLPEAAYDPEDPPMTEGSTYPNMSEFKLALSQHAIKHEFEFNTEKSTPKRFRGYCSRKKKIIILGGYMLLQQRT
ncbi:unnamed protein product [Urochloa humidicola]